MSTAAESYPVLPGCDAISHAAGSRVGALIVHGFTGNPHSVSGVVDAVITAGHDVEAPRLPGHGTHVDDLLDAEWDDWFGAVVAALDALAERVERTVVVGQSMGATLALAAALERPAIDGLVCINPATRARTADEMALIDDLIADGMEVAPGEGSDIADPDGFDITYDGTPLRAVRSFLVDGVAPISGRFGELLMPLRLLTSRNDHVVPPADSEHLAAAYGGRVEHTWLEHSYHVATRDFDRELVEAATVRFVDEATS